MNLKGNNLRLRPALSTGEQLMILFGLMLALLFIGALFSQTVANVLHLDSRATTLCGAVFQNIFAFIAPAAVAAWFSGENIFSRLSLEKEPSLRAAIGIILVFICATPAFNALVEWNENIHLPESMSALEQSLRIMEQSASDTTRGVLDVSSFGAMLAGVMIIGLLTGLGEEIFFRSGVQTTLCARRWVSPIVAIWTTAFIFSVMHFQFFGFFPRLLMGAYFGFILYWTGSVWNCAIAHAFNNSFVVISSWLEANGEDFSSGAAVTPGSLTSYALIAASIATVALLLTIGRSYFFRK